MFNADGVWRDDQPAIVQALSGLAAAQRNSIRILVLEVFAKAGRCGLSLCIGLATATTHPAAPAAWPVAARAQQLAAPPRSVMNSRRFIAVPDSSDRPSLWYVR